ncbi:hypothetical protein FZC33_05530 [Labrys sp. KNU-23]|uniref:hypothetical protein n=1 Tax=Labrys sp. KNU-23 TaxID=2789216 RepID=UPI0011EC8D69|nr:hypothetical protein [Labrys sp. KNU-23]QEN85695.1 hypothetical protein FZC33_05530 [Labrys sp. KNU-23]
MSGQLARIGTAALCMAVAGFTVWRSVPVLGFALAEHQAEESTDTAPLKTFAATLETGALAEAAMQSAIPQARPADRIEAATRLLKRRPLSSNAWFDLATARLADGKGMAEVAQALRLSALTGPNESVLMASRALFALSLWSALPDDLRRRTAQDIAGGWDRFETSDKLVMRLTLSTSPVMRTELTTLLRQADGMNRARLDDLGLGPAAPAQPEGSVP